MRIEIVAGDTEPLELDLLENAKAESLAGATARFVMGPVPAMGLTAPRIDAAADIVDQTRGTVRYVWASGETDLPGIYEAQFVVVHLDGTTATFPSEPIMLVITRRAGT